MENTKPTQDVMSKPNDQRPRSNMSGSYELDQLAVNTIRFLSADAVQKANSGHPGAPMGAAAMAYTLWSRFLRHNPANPKWFNRDRFVLSAGHASMLLYSLLHLTGYDLSLDDLKDFRQWGSKTPGHPEYGDTPGVETTTGPLGQGFATGVGMAVAERFLAAKFNRPHFDIIDHYTYGIVSDGDLQEGISYESASFAGHFKLGNLIYLYDDNKIQIEGSTDLTFSDDVRKRFEAVHWHVIGPVEGENVEAIESAIREAQTVRDKPSLIIVRTHIAYGSPGKMDSASAHGEPLGQEELLASKKNLGWPVEPDFYVPPEVKTSMNAVNTGTESENQWKELLEKYGENFPDEHQQLIDFIQGRLPLGWDSELDGLFGDQEKPLATRAASGMILNAIADKIKNIMGGSADLGPSNKTVIKTDRDFSADDYSMRNIHFGVREHSMAAIANGMALHGGVIPYTGTFLQFFDYMKPSMRLAALMGLPTIHVFTHDSIGLGEDGPTHQPIEHLESLRAIPNMTVFRPADANEAVYGWRAAVSNQTGPTTLVFTRQKLPILKNSPEAARGAYVIWEADSSFDAILIATGSEVHTALAAGQKLNAEGIKVRVVSMPCCEIFEAQPQDYKHLILPPDKRVRVAVEAATTAGWYRYVGLDGAVIGIDHFGASAPSPVLFEKFGFTPENIIATVKRLLGK